MTIRYNDWQYFNILKIKVFDNNLLKRVFLSIAFSSDEDKLCNMFLRIRIVPHAQQSSPKSCHPLTLTLVKKVKRICLFKAKRG